MAHRMTAIGGGYVWPNITIFSDGERVVLLTKPTSPRPQEPLRYITDFAAVVPASEFECAFDDFFHLVLGQLRAEGVKESNFEQVFADLTAERADPQLSIRRRFEALLGHDTDDAKAAELERLVADGRELGDQAMFEVAAASAGRKAPDASEIRTVADSSGFDTNPREAARLDTTGQLPEIGKSPAWLRGREAARALRTQEKLGADEILNQTLEDLVAVSHGAIENKSRFSDELAFLLEVDQSSRVVIRSKRETGRRFELARLLGDRVAMPAPGKLRPATRAYTYRQKMQRSFAAEFLCPFEAAMDMLRGDYSVEAIADVSAHFNVSDQTVRTLLVNHGLLDRDDLEFERADSEIQRAPSVA